MASQTETCVTRVASAVEDLKTLGEFGLIDRIANHPSPETSKVICGIGDDCAVYGLEGGRVRLVTTDMMVESTHFLSSTPPEGLGHKILAVSLSDIAAMGGTPTDAVISLAIPPDLDPGYIERLYHGLYACADRFSVAVTGGDTTRSPGPLVLNLTLTGEMLESQICYRRGARPGDLIYVSGTLGDAAAALALLSHEIADFSPNHRSYLYRRHYRPEPRVILGKALAESGAVTSMIDISDGITSDLRHICDQSQASAAIREETMPLSPAYSAYCEISGVLPMDMALSGGEDFELLFSVDPAQESVVQSIANKGRPPSLHCIGRIEAGPPLCNIVDTLGDSRPLDPTGYDHFKQ